jgi:glycerol-3-phosphate dehydrogenase
MRTYDVVIVGGGVVGCAIARRLSLTRATVALLEAASDVGEGASKGNSGIASCGAETTPGTLESQLILGSADAWEALCAALDTPFERIGGLNVALTAEEEERLPAMLAEAKANGVPAEIVSGADARRLEPLLTPAARAALHVPGDGIIDPIRLTIGYAELAARNNAEILRATRVTGARREGDRLTVLETTAGPVGARWVVNAAGVEADTVAAFAGGAALSSWPRHGQAWLLDRELGRHFRKIVGGIPDEVTRGVYVTPTTNRSVLVGPTARNHEDRDDRRTDGETLDAIMERGRRLVPSIAREHAIKVFAANRPAGDPVYRVERDATVANLVHAAAIRSTGVSSSPAVAEHVRALLHDAGAPVGEDRPDAILAIQPLPRLLGHTRPEELVALDPRYGQVICACEQVTAAEIAAAFAMRVPPRTLDAVRKRTRATGGRCQGAYCQAGVSLLCSAYGGLRPEDVWPA